MTKKLHGTAAAMKKDRVEAVLCTEISRGYLFAGTGSAVVTMRAMLFSMVSLGT